jgi:hypothetical protein
VLEQYVTEIRLLLGFDEHPALWLTERGGRISGRHVDERFADLRSLEFAHGAHVADRAGVDLAGDLVRLHRADRCRDTCQGISATRLDHGRGVAVDGVVFRPAGVAGVSALGAPEQPALPAGDW